MNCTKWEIPGECRNEKTGRSRSVGRKKEEANEEGASTVADGTNANHLDTCRERTWVGDRAAARGLDGLVEQRRHVLLAIAVCG